MLDFQEAPNKLLEEYSRLPHYMEKELLYIMYERDCKRIKELAPLVPLEKLASVFKIPLNVVKRFVE
jgi:hypothetical protein